jgi:hypothetical protein
MGEELVPRRPARVSRIQLAILNSLEKLLFCKRRKKNSFLKKKKGTNL